MINNNKKHIRRKLLTKDNVKENKNEHEDEEEGFGNWLRSENGASQMKMFVVANFMVVFMTIAWPHIVQAFEIIASFLKGE